jgi:hypothetical protein
MNKETLIVSRQWNCPAIRVFMNQKEVGAEMDIKEFLEALVENVGNPTFLVTKAQMLNKLNEAAEAVIVEMKRATIHI